MGERVRGHSVVSGNRPGCCVIFQKAKRNVIRFQKVFERIRNAPFEVFVCVGVQSFRPYGMSRKESVIKLAILEVSDPVRFDGENGVTLQRVKSAEFRNRVRGLIFLD